MQQTRQQKYLARTGQCWGSKKMSSSCTVHSTCSIYIIEESQCGHKGPYNHNGSSAEFLLPDGCRRMSVPEMETVVLLQTRRGEWLPWHSSILCCREPCPIPSCCVSQNTALAVLTLFSVLLTSNSLYLL